MDIYDFLEQEYGGTVDKRFHQAKVKEWASWYAGNVKTFHHYKIYNGKSSVRMKRASLNMAKTVCEDWANLLLNEKVKITAADGVSQGFLDSVLKQSNWAVKSNEYQEKKAAIGTVAYIPYITGAEMSEDGTLSGGKIKIDYVTVQNIFPLSWENGVITECVFACDKVIEKKRYKYIRAHRIGEGGMYTIENKLLECQNGNLTEVALNSVKGFETVPELIRTGSKKRTFVIDRLNIANNTDDCPDNPLGISVFANAIDVLQGIDLVYDSYNNEFNLGKKRIMVTERASSFKNDEPVFDSNDTVFYVLPEDIKDDKVLHEIDMTLRAEEHETALQNRLNLLSQKCGFGQNYYQFNRGNVQTATQVISENSTLYSVLCKHEIILESAIKELASLIFYYGKTVIGADVDPDKEVSVDFDDSVITSREQEETRALALFNAKLIDAVEYFVRTERMEKDKAIKFVEEIRARMPQEEGGTDWFGGA